MSEIVNRLDDYFNWDHQILSCATATEISDLEKTKAKQAFTFLRKELGEDFPTEIQKTHTHFRTYFWNKAAWTRVWFTWLGDAIKNLKECDNFNGVLKKLRSNTWDDFEEAVTLLEYGLKFKKAGFKVDFEKETVNTSGKTKNPDLHLTNLETGENVFVEVTRLIPNAEIEELSQIYHKVLEKGFLSGRQLNCCGRIFKSVSKEHLREIKQEIENKVDEALKNNSFEEFKREGIIEMAFSAENGYHILEQWSAEHGYKINSFVLPEVDRFKRLKNKIVRKSNQSSPGCSNLLIIKNDDFTSISRPEKTFYELEETLYKCEDLLGVIIISYEFGNQDKKVESYGMNTFITRTERYALASSINIMLNKFYKKVPVTLHTLTRVIEAFERN